MLSIIGGSVGGSEACAGGVLTSRKAPTNTLRRMSRERASAHTNGTPNIANGGPFECDGAAAMVDEAGKLVDL